MVSLHVVLSVVLWYCVATTQYYSGSLQRPTTFVQAAMITTSMPQVHRRRVNPTGLLPPSLSPMEFSPSPHDDGLNSSSVGELIHGINSTENHDITFHNPTNPAPMKHYHHYHHRRARNVRGTLYWGAVYTILFGGVIALMSILMYVFGIFPACCYPSTDSDNSNDQNDCATKVSIIEYQYRNRWWRYYFLRFFSSSDRTSSDRKSVV